MDSQSIDNAWNVFVNNFNIQEGESILVVTDDKLEEIGDLFYQAAAQHAYEVASIKMPAIYKSGEEPPIAISSAMANSDVVLCITSSSLTHTKAKTNACSKGARVGTMPGIDLAMLTEGAITADPKEIETLTTKYTEILENGSNVRIIKNGEILTFSIEGRHGISSTGIINEKGASGNVPSGESYIAPIEDSANGVLIVDGSIAEIGIVEEPIKLIIEKGRLIDATGKDGQQLLEILGEDEGRIIAEFGIGTNPAALIRGNVLEDEKVYGTIHIAFGSNRPFGGVTEAGVHIDCVVKSPEVWIDEDKII